MDYGRKYSMIRISNYKKPNMALIDCTEHRSKITARFMEDNGCPYIAPDMYICNYWNGKVLATFKDDAEFDNDFVEDYTIWRKIKTYKEESLTNYLSKVNHDIGDRFGMSLFDHQEDAAYWLAERNAAILADSMGLGKSLSAILAIPKKVPVLIVASANSKYVWLNQFKRWVNRDCEVLFGRKSFRWPKDNEILISNYDIMPEELYVRPPKNLKGRDLVNFKNGLKKAKDALLKQCPQGMVVIMDEAHRVKNPKAMRSKRLHFLNKAVKENYGKAWALTGTPVNQGGEDLGGILYVLDALEESFGNRPNFIYQFGGRSTGFGIEWSEPKKSAVNFMRNVVKRRIAEQVFDLPKSRDEKIYIETTDEVREACREFEDICAKLNIGLEEAMDAARDPRSQLYHHVMRLKALLATAKIPAVEDIVEDYEEAREPLIVACTHVAPLKYFAERKGWALIDGSVSSKKRDEIERDFQAGKYKGLALSILAGGEALTLTYCAHMVIMDTAWTPGPESQVRKRIDRPGQKRPMLYKKILVDHPLEDRIISIVERKEKIVQGTIDLLVER